jgi:hypothetical protein
MPHRFPSKIVNAIEADVKKADKQAHAPVWQGFGSIAEAHMSPDQEKAILVWRQAGSASEDALRTSFMVGIFHRMNGVWIRKEICAANYKSTLKHRDVDTIIKREKESWTNEPATAD